MLSQKIGSVDQRHKPDPQVPISMRNIDWYRSNHSIAGHRQWLPATWHRTSQVPNNTRRKKEKRRKEKEKKKPFVRTKQNPQSPVSNHTQRRPITALSRPMNEHLRHWVRGTQWWMGRLGYGRRRCCLECHTALPIMGFLPHWDFDTSKP